MKKLCIWFSCIKIVLLSMDILMFRFFFFIFRYRATLEQLRCEPGAWTFWVSSPNKEQCNHCARILHHQLCINDLVTYCKYSPFQRGFRFQFWLLEARFKCYDLYSDFFFFEWSNEPNKWLFKLNIVNKERIKLGLCFIDFGKKTTWVQWCNQSWNRERQFVT